MINGDLQKDLKHDVNNEHLNGNIETGVEQDPKEEVNKPAATVDIKAETKLPAM